MAVQVPEIHFDKPHFLIPIPRKAMVPAEWLTAANQLIAPVKPVDKVEGAKSGNEGSAQATSASVTTTKGTSEKTTADNSDSESDTETVAFAWFCEMIIGAKFHDCYCELNEGAGLIRLE